MSLKHCYVVVCTLRVRVYVLMLCMMYVLLIKEVTIGCILCNVFVLYKSSCTWSVLFINCFDTYFCHLLWICKHKIKHVSSRLCYTVICVWRGKKEEEIQGVNACSMSIWCMKKINQNNLHNATFHNPIIKYEHFFIIVIYVAFSMLFYTAI